MDKKDEKDTKFYMPLIICTYLIIDVILLFGLCLLELNGVSHTIILIASFIIEFIGTMIVSLKGNIRSAIILYILFLVSPAFLNVIAMSMLFVSDKIPFTPTLLLLFRTGYTLEAVMLDKLTRLLLAFRIPALMGIFVSTIINIMKNPKN